MSHNAKVYQPQGAESLIVGPGGYIDLTAGAVKLAAGNLKLLAADGVDSTSEDAQVTLTGAAVGDRVVAIIGHAKANTGPHVFLLPTIGTHFEATISVANKIVQKQAAGNLSANTYLFVLSPA
ncbi:MAG TPA: hypothetical protein PK184_20565 [Phycisphaerae bacterium]|nr:hypothetical protein [Phycisphaerae bacterium]